MQQVIERLSQLIDELSAMEQENAYSVGDLVTFGDGLVGAVESYNDESITVRVQAVSGDTLEPTDDVRQMGYEEVQKYRQPSEVAEDTPVDGDESDDTPDVQEDEDEDTMKAGAKVSFNTIAGKTYGIVTKIDTKATIEVYNRTTDGLYEPTGVKVRHEVKHLALDRFKVKSVSRKLMCKFAGDISLQQDDEHVATFKGVLSSYGNVDLGGDVVAKGAYTQTLLHKGGKVKLFFDHFYGVKDVAGVAYLEDKEDGLHMTGVMPVKATDVRNAVIKMQFMLEHEEPLGLSIGYNAVKSSYDLNGNRILQEIALEEASITPFPMDTRAKIYEAKARKAMYEAKRSHWQTIVQKSDAPTSNRYSEGDDIKSLLSELKSIIKTIN
jgi:HK97 family phage prohead protease